MNEDQLKNLIKKSLNIKKVDNKTSFQNTPAWDSLGQLNIMIELDKKLKGKTFEIDKIPNAYSSKKLIKLLKSKKLLK